MRSERMQPQEGAVKRNPFKSGDRVIVRPFGEDIACKDLVLEQVIEPHGEGPFEVVGAGPTKVAIKTPSGNVNILWTWAEHAPE